MTEKATALETIRNLSEHATLAEIIEELSIWGAIQRGRADVAAGRVVSHEDAKARLAAMISR